MKIAPRLHLRTTRFAAVAFAVAASGITGFFLGSAPRATAQPVPIRPPIPIQTGPIYNANVGQHIESVQCTITSLIALRGGAPGVGGSFACGGPADLDISTTDPSTAALLTAAFYANKPVYMSASHVPGQRYGATGVLVTR